MQSVDANVQKRGKSEFLNTVDSEKGCGGGGIYWIDLA